LSLRMVDVLFPVTAVGFLPSLCFGDAYRLKGFERHGATVSNAVGSHRILRSSGVPFYCLP
jgi:hypothetical protein